MSFFFILAFFILYFVFCSCITLIQFTLIIKLIITIFLTENFIFVFI
jgi:hypothetical protein